MQALLDAIAATPDDDQPRLVYADWLIERGDPRGELIQLQCALAGVPSWDVASRPLRARVNELWREHHARWEPPLDTVERVSWIFARGFPWVLEGNASTLVAATEELRRKAPTLRGAVASHFDVDVETFLSWPLLAQLGRVDLRYLPQPPPSRERLLRALLDDARFAHVRRLGISYTFLDQEEWEAIARSSLLPRLEGLDLALGNATDLSLVALMSQPSSLRELNVANGQVGTGGVRAIAGSPHARSLEDLDVSWNRVGVKGTRALAESEHLGRLRVLDLAHCQIGDDGCEAIARGALTALKVLRLSQSRVTARGVRLLVESERLRDLAELDVDHNDLDEATLALVRSRFPDATAP